MDQTDEKRIEECLARLEAGEALDEILKRYPAESSLLRRRLAAAEWLLKRGAALEPSPAFLESSRTRLTGELRQRTTPRRKTDRWISTRLRRASLALQPGVVILFCLVLLNIPFQLFQAAQNALPGDHLFTLKRFQEEARLALTFDSFADALLQMRFTQQRAAEMQELMLVGRFEHVELALASFQSQHRRAEQAIEFVGQRDPLLAENMHQIMKDSLREQNVVFSFLIPMAPRGLRTGLEQALLLASR